MIINIPTNCSAFEITSITLTAPHKEAIPDAPIVGFTPLDVPVETVVQFERGECVVSMELGRLTRDLTNPKTINLTIHSDKYSLFGTITLSFSSLCGPVDKTLFVGKQGMTINKVELSQPIMTPAGYKRGTVQEISPTDYLYTDVFEKYAHALVVTDVKITPLNKEITDGISAMQRMKNGEQLTTEDVPRITVVGLEALIRIHRILAITEFANGLQLQIAPNNNVITDPSLQKELTELAFQLQKAINKVITTAKQP